ncbi:Isocitrate dehydrogenase NAD-dependent [Penicillium cf. griseofulvum]|nr:Isocitrate dehydrogenase NAD-dependent [Penicillium cf. griseofulvum]
MIAARNFSVARQCMRPSRVARFATPIAQVRFYASPAQEAVAKFKGQKGPDGKYTVTLIEGDGIGPEISQSIKDIFEAAKVLIS